MRACVHKTAADARAQDGGATSDRPHTFSMLARSGRGVAVCGGREHGRHGGAVAAAAQPGGGPSLDLGTHHLRRVPRHQRVRTCFLMTKRAKALGTRSV